MLGTEPQVIAEYVDSGQARIFFWPVLNHANPSLYASVTAECVAQQDMAAFWRLHHDLFERQNELWTATRDDFIAFAVAAGADGDTFARCYDGAEAVGQVLALDALRRERGVYTQPVFDINGARYFGSQSFATFAGYVEAALQEGTE